MSPPQRLRAGLLRGCLRLLFRGLVRPPMPVALQRGVLRGLSLATLGAGQVRLVSIKDTDLQPCGGT
ncbi:hypothetical protein K3Z98_32050, partial [Pseudomonas aeruginosa]|nr:hypothetical protein [Pseudomonas aeruginosa]